ncbi:MAG: membrane protein insertion efficiency factor YidD [Candidatus Omnitrophica bacterium]|nr:membrane protein insertion efficiency factor YidD [Candidatus Omnitrophota bacterium]
MLKKLSIGLLTAYQRYLRTMLPCTCRYWPSCSEYTKQAITKYGLLKGILKGSLRLSRCHPFYPKSGYDPLI